MSEIYIELKYDCGDLSAKRYYNDDNGFHEEPIKYTVPRLLEEYEKLYYEVIEKQELIDKIKKHCEEVQEYTWQVCCYSEMEDILKLIKEEEK